MFDIDGELLIILGVITIILIILAYLELKRCRKICKFKSLLPQDYYVILPRFSGLNYPVYIYNSSKVHRRDIKYERDYNAKDYRKMKLNEHIIPKLYKCLMKSFSTFRSIIKSNTPISTLYKSISGVDDIINTVNPMTMDVTKYKMLIHKDDMKNDVFVDYNTLLIV